MRFLKNKIAQANAALGSLPLRSNSSSDDELSIIKKEEEDLLSNNQIAVKCSDETKFLDETSNYLHTTNISSNSTKEDSSDHPYSQQSQQKQVNKRNTEDNDIFSKKATKNIAIHYGKAIASFATSYMAIPYIKEQNNRMNFVFSDFIKYVNKSKPKITSMGGLLSILHADENDDPLTVTYKKLLQYISEIFIKYFSVNWITHSKLTHKMTYLKYRFKMLRRIQNHENLLYIKTEKHEE